MKLMLYIIQYVQNIIISTLTQYKQLKWDNLYSLCFLVNQGI